MKHAQMEDSKNKYLYDQTKGKRRSFDLVLRKVPSVDLSKKTAGCIYRVTVRTISS